MWDPSHRQPVVHYEVFEQDGLYPAVGNIAPLDRQFETLRTG